ncbi:MAG: hypothetical protein JST89_00190 [Cyanobacteria bacterium SZAS-4]|nr:hypothetical protein [Cyanobacteria bacterium SZAS-4]
MLACSAIFLITLYGCTENKNTVATTREIAPVVEPINQPLPPRSDTQTIPEAIKSLKLEYKVRPDRRMLGAFKAVYEIAFGKNADVFAESAQSGWTIHCNGRVAAELSDGANFAEQFDKLAQWSKILVQERALVLAPEDAETANLSLKSPSPADLFAVSENCNQLWKRGKKTANVLKTNARALAWLTAEQIDALELNDSVYGCALANLALLASLTNENLFFEQCMIADAMEYTADAKLYASKLPDSDPLKELILKQRFDLVRKQNPFEDYLYCRSLKRNGNLRQFAEYVERHYKTDTSMRLPVLAEECRLAAGYSRCAVLLQILSDVKLIAENKKLTALPNFSTLRWSKSQSEDSLRWLPANMSFIQNDSAPTPSGLSTISPENLKQRFYESVSFNALMSLSDEYLTLDPSFNVNLLTSVGGNSDAAKFLKKYIGLCSANKLAEASVSDLLSFVDESRKYGGYPAYYVLKNWSSDKYYRPMQLSESTSLFRRYLDVIDARPGYLYQAAQLADIPFWNGFAASFFRGMSYRLNPDIVNELDDTSITNPLKYVESADFTIDEKLKCLEIYERVAGNSPLMNRCYSSLAKSYPNSAKVQIAWSRQQLYSRSPGLKARCDQLKRWIDSHHPDANERSALLIMEADMLFYLKEYSQAASVTAAVPEKTSDSYVRMHIKNLVAARKPSEALQWCQGLLERHTSVQNLATVIYSLWSFEKFEDAADLVEHHRQALTPQVWNTRLAGAFSNAFETREGEGPKAIQALLKHGFANSDELIELAHGLRAQNKNALALAVCDAGITNTNYDQLTWMYSCLRDLTNEERAISWLKSKIPLESNKGKVAIPAFVSGADELLWKFIPEQPSTSESDSVWLLRAASISAPTPSQREKVLVAVKDKNTVHALLTKYLINAIPEQTVLDTRVNKDELCTVAFFLGWKHIRSSTDLGTLFKYWRLAQESEAPVPETKWANMWSETVQRVFGYSTLGVSGAARFVQVVRQEGKRLIGRDFTGFSEDTTSFGGGRYQFVLRSLTKQPKSK